MSKKMYKPGDIVDLDDVLLSRRAVENWHAEVKGGRLRLIGINPADIPIEQGLILADGSLEIFVEVPKGLFSPQRFSVKVPPQEWRFVT